MIAMMVVRTDVIPGVATPGIADLLRAMSIRVTASRMQDVAVIQGVLMYSWIGEPVS